MTYQEYQIAASRTCVSLATKELDARHMKMGVTSEVGELVDVYKKELAYGKTLDLVNIEEEWADCAWYLANQANQLGITIDNNTAYQELTTITNENIEDILLCFVEDFNRKSTNKRPDYMFNYWVLIGKQILKIDTDKALENNIAKLKTRYPNSFTQEAALNRDLDAERKELEK